MHRYNCIIVEDEPLAAEVLKDYILQIPFLQLKGICTDALYAMDLLQKEKIDLMFLDIHLPKLKGLDFIKTLKKPPQVIITSAYQEYALQGYELNVVDYLLKPFSYERFNKAVEKVKQLTVQNIHTPDERRYLVIKEKEGLLKIPYEEVLYIEASKDYMKIFTPSRQYLTHLTMKKLEELLPAQLFIRTHKSFIVALKQIKLLKTDSLVLANNATIPVSLSYKEEVMRKFRS